MSTKWRMKSGEFKRHRHVEQRETSQKHDTIVLMRFGYGRFSIAAWQRTLFLPLVEMTIHFKLSTINQAQDAKKATIFFLIT